MISSRSRLYPAIFWILALIVGGGLVWANWTFSRANPLDSPYLVQWTAIRGLVTGGQSPYDPSTWQIADLLSPGQDSTTRHIFSQPFYVVVLLLPFALISDLTVSRTVWMLALELALVGIIIVLPGLRQWKPGRFSFLLLVGFVFLGLHSIQALAASSSAVLASLFLILALGALHKDWDEAAGLSLVFATIQPEATLPAVLFVLFWGLNNRRGRLAAWFVGGLLLVSFVGFFFLPGWPVEYVRVLIQYWSEMSGVTLAEVFNQSMPGISIQLTWGFRLASIALLIVEWFSARNKDFDWFLWTTGLTVSLTPWLGFPTTLENLILLVLPVFLFQSVWDERVGRKDHWLPLIMMCVFWLGLWGMALYQIALGRPLIPGFLFHLPFLSLVGLYWVRWWYIRPLHRYQDLLRSHEALR